MALPSDSLQKLLRLVVGLLLLTVMLQPLEKVLQSENYLNLADNLTVPAATTQASLDSAELTGQEAFRSLYKRRLEKQLELELSRAGFAGCQVFVEIDDNSSGEIIQRLRIISPQAIDVKTKNHLAADYNISRQSIEIFCE